MSSIVNKVKEVLHHDNHSTTGTSSTSNTTGTAEGVHGPHSSRVANAADPRIDSDRDGKIGAAGTTAHGTNAATAGTGTAEGVHGPHSSRLANTVDPRVDSDRDGHVGAAGAVHGRNAATTGTSTGTGYDGTTGTTANTSTAGPHSSNMANRLDPTVDSNSYGTGQTGTNVGNHALGGTSGDRGGLSNSTNAGPHNSNLANKVDPRVDSDLDSTGNRHGASHGGILGTSGSHATAGSGTAQNTQGPHNSDTLNKLDPRVDADGDGSRTFGGNRTHATSSDQKDPTNAAHVTPSVLAEHIGHPTVLHDDANAKHAERHGSLSHQEKHI